MRLPFPQNEYARDYRAMLAGRDVFIHDFDGVHYDYEDFGDNPTFFDYLAGIKARVMRELIPGLPHCDDELKAIGKSSYLQTGDGLLFFAEIAAGYGLDKEKFRLKIHTEFHRNKCNGAPEMRPDVFARCQETNEAFETLGPNVRHGLLTQSSVTHWARPILDEKMDRLKFFESDVLVGYEDCGFISKRNSVEPLAHALAKMNVDPSRVVFIEDSAENLFMAKKLSPQILTVHCCHGRINEPLPDFIDMRVPKPKHILHLAAEARKPAQQHYFMPYSQLVLTP